VSDLGFIHRFEPGSNGETMLLFHGTGGDEDDLLPIGRRLAPNANLLAPRGQVLENGMLRFFRRLDVGVFDEADLIRRARDLDRFVRAAAGHYGFDLARVCALGYSNGANMAAALLLLHPELLAGAVLLRAILPLTPARPPDLSGKHVLIAAGRRDPYAAVERVDALADLMKRFGASVDLRWVEGGHEIHDGEVEGVGEWLCGPTASHRKAP
jgi:predicted esterase